MTFLKNLSEDKQAITLYKYNGNDLKVDPNLEVQKNNKDFLDKSIKNVKYIVTDDNIDHPIQTFNHSQIEEIASKIYYENS